MQVYQSKTWEIPSEVPGEGSLRRRLSDRLVTTGWHRHRHTTADTGLVSECVRADHRIGLRRAMADQQRSELQLLVVAPGCHQMSPGLDYRWRELDAETIQDELGLNVIPLLLETRGF